MMPQIQPSRHAMTGSTGSGSERSRARAGRLRHGAIGAMVLLGLLACASRSVRAQELEETLSQLGAAYARAYTQPLADAVGANLNAGLNEVPVHRDVLGFHLYFGIRAFGALLHPSEQTFDLVYRSTVDLDTPIGGDTYRVSVPATFEVRGAPTIFGSDDPAVATVTARFDTTVNHFGVRVPVSFDTTITRQIVGGILKTDIVPTAVPQLRVGTVFGTDVVVRYLPRITVKDVGALELFGLGVRHSISQYVPALPIGLSVQLFWQQVGADDSDGDRILKASTFAGSLAASHRFGILTLYGSVQTERATLDVDYELRAPEEIGEQEPIPISFRLVGTNTNRATLGVGLNLGPVQVNGSYSFGHVDVLTTSLGVAL